MANALVGISQRSLEIGVEYVAEREAFDQKIGGFQAVGHRLADCKVATDGAELLAHEAAWAADEDPHRYPELATMAYAFASQTAKDTSYWALHFHGGYGFMLEYDIQLYYRRARAWANVLMDASRAYRRFADLRYGRQRSELMDFRLGESSDELACRGTRVPRRAHEPRARGAGVPHRGVPRRGRSPRPSLSGVGSRPSWPVELGGQGRDPIEMIALAYEIRATDAPALWDRHHDPGGDGDPRGGYTRAAAGDHSPCAGG